METESRKRIAAALLFVGAAVSTLAAWRLKVLGESLDRRPAGPGWYLLTFSASIILAFLAGRLVSGHTERACEVALRPAATPGRLQISLRALSAFLCLVLFGAAWFLHGHRSPFVVLAVWGGSLLAGAGIFTGARSNAASMPAVRGSRVLFTALLLVLLVAVRARVVALDRIPAAFGGDEANQATDGTNLIRGGSVGDPFGTGWGNTVRLGMLPAGAGSLWGSDRIAGPRLPYAIAASLSVAASAATAGVVAGPWGALSCASLLAFSPYHVHFSRLASVMILDACFASLTVLFLVHARRSGSTLSGYLGGLAAGLSIYGYAGGRAIVAAVVLSLPVLFLSSAAHARPFALLAVVLLGLALAVAPGLRFAAKNLNEWEGRFNEVSIFHRANWEARLKVCGSPRAVLEDQFLSGTIGLLSRHTSWTWFTGYPYLAPVFLPAFSLVGFGWMLGRRQFFAAALPGLIAAGNLAGVILTESSPAPQRISSLVPMLALFSGAAVGGFLELLPECGRWRGTPWRSAAGALVIGSLLSGTYRGAPDVWDPSPGYSGDGGAFVTGLCGLLCSPRYAGERIYLHSRPHIDSAHPLFGYLLPRIQWTDVAEMEEEKTPAPGLHVFFREWMPLGQRWKEQLGIRYAVIFSDPAQPRRALALMLRVPG